MRFLNDCICHSGGSSKHKVIEYIDTMDYENLNSFLFYNPKAVNAKDEEGNPALLISLQKGQSQMAVLMIHRGAYIGRKKNNVHKNMIKKIKTKLKYLDLSYVLPRQPIHVGESALEMAVNSCYFEVADALIQRGVSVSMLDSNGWPLLVTTSFYGNLDGVRYLLGKGASPNHVTHSGRTALIKASQKGYLSICELLVQAGADVRQKSLNNFTALIAASLHNHGSVVSFLCKHGADVHSGDKFGKTGLHYSIQYGQIDITETLIRYGADIYSLDYFRQKAIDYTASAEAAQVLIGLHEREVAYRARRSALLVSAQGGDAANIFSRLRIRDSDAWRSVIRML